MKLKLLILLLFTCYSADSQDYDLVIKNGRVIDGTGNPWFRADIGIRNGKIAEIGQIKRSNAKSIIDANDHIVAPGFIDIHTHIEWSLFAHPTANNFIHDGVTSIITGNCGDSEVHIGSFLKKVEDEKVSVNVGSFIGHGSVRTKVLGNANKKPNNSQSNLMQKYVANAMKEGALGLSTGLVYVPGTYASIDEVIDLAKVAKKHNGIYTSHIRNEGEKVREAVEEAIEVGRQSGIPVQISHFKIAHKPLWGQSFSTLFKVDQARLEGLDIGIDQYPYTAASTGLDYLIPSWALEGTTDEIKKRFDKNREKIIAEMVESLRSEEREHFDYAYVADYQSNPELVGKNIREINLAINQADSAEVEANLILNLHLDGFAQMVYHWMSDEDVLSIMQYPHTIIASDGGVNEPSATKPHPRSYGTNARVLGTYVRDQLAMPLEEAIRKMTSLPAQRMGIKDRGSLRIGNWADITIFDENKITDLATFDEPHQYSQGFEYVIVNGKIVLNKGKHNGAKPGQIIYGNGKTP
ncbi:N-acyl-D-amino-acid deacylase [Spirosomataceae bacterium TFI 002]|nr:N-acyl-D-amino-acid deacylase [Spirosomataceae bacterium TFI 002]